MFSIYVTLMLLDYYQNALFWFFVLAFFFLSMNSMFIGYSLSHKDYNKSSFYTKHLFNNNRVLQKKFYKLFFCKPAQDKLKSFDIADIKNLE
jgi:hypothetical protein